MSTALTADVDSVKDAALSLPVSARAYLAEALLESLDRSDDELSALAVKPDWWMQRVAGRTAEES